MKFRTNILFTSLILLPVLASSQWGPAQKVFSASSTRIHPAFRRLQHPVWGNGAEELLAFTQVTGSGSRICLVHTLNTGTSWSDSVQELTGDSAWNDYATLALTSFNWHDSTMMILWQRGQDNPSIWYRYNPDTAWRQETRLTGLTDIGSRPNLFPVDSGYFAVWESRGRIAFASFFKGVWSIPEFVTPAPDTINSNPQVTSLPGWFGAPIALVVWERVSKPPDTCAIVYSIRTLSAWSAFDTIAWSGDNRNPRVSPPSNPLGGGVQVSYESNRKGIWEIFAANAWQMDTASPSWANRDELVSEESAAVDHRDATLYYWPIVTTHSSGPVFYPDVASVWREGSGPDDSIALSSYSWLIQRETIAPGSTNRNPVLSTGIWRGWTDRVFAVWENNATGIWDLYASSIDLIMESVRDRPGLPANMELRQNYPNPFNSTTRFEYRTSRKEFVNLKVFDVLGREVATLVHEEKVPGTYTVTWDATGNASGVYICQMKAGGYVSSRKILLLR